MTLEEKIARYRSIPNRIKELEIDKCICESVGAVRYDSIGEAKGTHGNTMENKMLDSAAISVEIEKLEKERCALKLEILQEINQKIGGDDARSIEKRIVLKECIIENKSLSFIADNILHRAYSLVRKLNSDGFEALKK